MIVALARKLIIALSALRPNTGMVPEGMKLYQLA